MSLIRLCYTRFVKVRRHLQQENALSVITTENRVLVLVYPLQNLRCGKAMVIITYKAQCTEYAQFALVVDVFPLAAQIDLVHGNHPRQHCRLFGRQLHPLEEGITGVVGDARLARHRYSAHGRLRQDYIQTQHNLSRGELRVMERRSDTGRVTEVAVVAFVAAVIATVLLGLLTAIGTYRFAVRITEMEP